MESDSPVCLHLAQKGNMRTKNTPRSNMNGSWSYCYFRLVIALSRLSPVVQIPTLWSCVGLSFRKHNKNILIFHVTILIYNNLPTSNL